MSEIVNIIKLTQLREYLNQRGVSQKMLLNPRFDEILGLIIDEIPFISIDNNQETIERLDKKIEMLDNRGIKIVLNPNSDIISCYPIENGIKIKRKLWKDGILETKKSEYDRYGIEQKQKLETTKIEQENFNNDKIEYIPNKEKEIFRSEKRPEIIKVVEREQNREHITYKIRKKFLEFENLEISERNKKRFCIKSDSDIYYSTDSRINYYMLRDEIIKPNYDLAVMEYEMYNKRYGFTRIYENGIRKMCLKEKMLGGN